MDYYDDAIDIKMLKAQEQEIAAFEAANPPEVIEYPLVTKPVKEQPSRSWGINITVNQYPYEYKMDWPDNGVDTHLGNSKFEMSGAGLAWLVGMILFLGMMVFVMAVR